MFRKSVQRKRYEAKSRRCAVMRAAKERKRLERGKEMGEWKRVRTVLIAVNVSPDGRAVAVSGSGGWERCGSVRAVRGWLARELWGRRND